MVLNLGPAGDQISSVVANGIVDVNIVPPSHVIAAAPVAVAAPAVAVAAAPALSYAAAAPALSYAAAPAVAGHNPGLARPPGSPFISYPGGRLHKRSNYGPILQVRITVFWRFR